eukprot:TRINITY_DN4848_c0_g1_i1.p1 TRINITY_DN4848_c0_g1~~TRINITY_DN4848_c0_g1_i1.p1  ORF type:complete len:2378 (+),score=805.40 TRINITY_DN4848_c0_g1_i1:565-7134(+)
MAYVHDAWYRGFAVEVPSASEEVESRRSSKPFGESVNTVPSRASLADGVAIQVKATCSDIRGRTESQISDANAGYDRGYYVDYGGSALEFVLQSFEDIPTLSGVGDIRKLAPTGQCAPLSALATPPPAPASESDDGDFIVSPVTVAAAPPYVPATPGEALACMIGDAQYPHLIYVLDEGEWGAAAATPEGPPARPPPLNVDAEEAAPGKAAALPPLSPAIPSITLRTREFLEANYFPERGDYLHFLHSVNEYPNVYSTLAFVSETLVQSTPRTPRGSRRRPPVASSPRGAAAHPKAMRALLSCRPDTEASCPSLTLLYASTARAERAPSGAGRVPKGAGSDCGIEFRAQASLGAFSDDSYYPDYDIVGDRAGFSNVPRCESDGMATPRSVPGEARASQPPVATAQELDEERRAIECERKNVENEKAALTTEKAAFKNQVAEKEQEMDLLTMELERERALIKQLLAERDALREGKMSAEQQLGQAEKTTAALSHKTSALEAERDHVIETSKTAKETAQESDRQRNEAETQHMLVKEEVNELTTEQDKAIQYAKEKEAEAERAKAELAAVLKVSQAAMEVHYSSIKQTCEADELQARADIAAEHDGDWKYIVIAFEHASLEIVRRSVFPPHSPTKTALMEQTEAAGYEALQETFTFRALVVLEGTAVTQELMLSWGCTYADVRAAAEKSQLFQAQFGALDERFSFVASRGERTRIKRSAEGRCLLRMPFIRLPDRKDEFLQHFMRTYNKRLTPITRGSEQIWERRFKCEPRPYGFTLPVVLVTAGKAAKTWNGLGKQPDGFHTKVCDALGNSPLHQAVRIRNLTAVQACVKAGCDPNVRDVWGRTPVSLAAGYGDTEIVRFLCGVPHVRDSLMGDNQGETPLHHACKHGHVEVAKVLLRNRCDPYHYSLNDRTPMHLAVGAGAVPVLEAIVADPMFEAPDLVETPDIVRRVRGTLFMWTPEPLVQIACGMKDAAAAAMVEYLFSTRVEELGLEDRIDDPFARTVGEAGMDEISHGGVPTDTLSRRALPRRCGTTASVAPVKTASFLRCQWIMRVESRSAVVCAAHLDKPLLMQALLKHGAKVDRKLQGWVGWRLPTSIHIVEAAVYEGNTAVAQVAARSLYGASRSVIQPVCFAMHFPKKHPHLYNMQQHVINASLDIEQSAPQFVCPLVSCGRRLATDRSAPLKDPPVRITSALAEAIFAQDDRLLATLVQMCPTRTSEACVSLPESTTQPGTTYFASALWLACCLGETSAVDVLLSNNADPERGLFAVETSHAVPVHLSKLWKTEMVPATGCFGIGLLYPLDQLRRGGWIPKEHPAAHKSQAELRADRAACFSVVVRAMRGKQFVRLLRREPHATLTDAFVLRTHPLLLLALAGQDRSLYAMITTHGHFQPEANLRQLDGAVDYLLEGMRGEYRVATAQQLVAYYEEHSGKQVPWEACLTLLKTLCFGNVRAFNEAYYDVTCSNAPLNAWGSVRSASPNSTWAFEKVASAQGARPGTTLSLEQAGLDYYSVLSTPPRTADASAAHSAADPPASRGGMAAGGVKIWGGAGLNGFDSVPIQPSASFQCETADAQEAATPNAESNINVNTSAARGGSPVQGRSVGSPGGKSLMSMVGLGSPGYRPLSTLPALPDGAAGMSTAVKRAPTAAGASKQVLNSWYFNSLARGQMMKYWCGLLGARLEVFYGVDAPNEVLRIVLGFLPRALMEGDVIAVTELFALLPSGSDAREHCVRQLASEVDVVSALARWPLRHIPEPVRQLVRVVVPADALLHASVAHAPPASVQALIDLYLEVHPLLVERLDQPLPSKVGLPGVWSDEGLTPVHVACIRGLVEVLKAMISKGAKCTHLDASEDRYFVDETSPRPGSRSPEYAQSRCNSPGSPRAAKQHVTKFRFSMGRRRRGQQPTYDDLKDGKWLWQGGKLKPSDAILDRLREARWSWYERQRVIGLSPLQYLTPVALAQTQTFIRQDAILGGRIFHSVVSATKPFFTSLLDECGLFVHPLEYIGEALPPLCVGDDDGKHFFDPRGLRDDDVSVIGQQCKAKADGQLDSLAARYMSTVKKPNKDLLEMLNKKGAQLDRLELGSSYLGPKSMSFLLNELLPELPHLSHLGLRSCQVGNGDVKLLYKNAVEHPSLTSLDLSHNPDIYLDGGIKLRLLKQRNPKIAHIGLEATGVSPSLIQAIEGTHASNTIKA